MYEYDIALKQLLQARAGTLLRLLTGGAVIGRWHNVELPRVQTRRADLLGETVDGDLVHIELQARNDSEMALRMAEYALGIYREFGKLPRQIVLYVGQAPLAMNPVLGGTAAGPSGFVFRFALVDARDLEGGPLLDSEHVQDNVLAILTRLQDRAGAIRQILARISAAEEPARHTLLAQFLILSGLRSLAETVEKEAQRMPILNDILDHAVIGPAIRQGLEKGLQEGLEKGLQEGRQEMIWRMLERKFGRIPDSIRARVENCSAAELDGVAVRILEARSIEDLFPSTS